MSTFAEAIANTSAALAACAGDDARFEATLMAAHVAGIEPASLPMHASELFPGKSQQRLSDMVSRRLAGEPLQYILGRWEFMGLPFIVNPHALIPRQDTETLCEAVLENKGEGRTLLDMCCGTGCIGISLAKLGGFCPTLADISPGCLALARENAALNGIGASFLLSDMFSCVSGRFDVICCNPPYIPASELASLQPEVQREPRIALDGGADGLAFYRRIAACYRQHLAPNGTLYMEIGFGQAADVIKLFGRGSALRDLCGTERVIAVS